MERKRFSVWSMRGSTTRRQGERARRPSSTATSSASCSKVYARRIVEAEYPLFVRSATHALTSAVSMLEIGAAPNVGRMRLRMTELSLARVESARLTRAD